MINKQPKNDKNDQEPGAFPEHIPDDYDAARLANLAKIEVRGQTSIFDAATRGHHGNIWKPRGPTLLFLKYGRYTAQPKSVALAGSNARKS